ncbi:hypothetical protein DSO57_1035975 [Entomophthora muscae]|uniref:Uncharacterized protein n=1 Tax=Entomophthora muscae TaxID=34485 RepID=A0ACC2S1L0_9FUNG|nr:hypothetical protein DSO57_1035975 [Entomophthora muscae]
MVSVQTKVFLCVSLMIVGSHFASHTLSPIKDNVKKELGLSNTEFGLLQSSELLFQTLTPFIGGAVADVIGPGKSSLLASGAILGGEFLLAFASTVLPTKYQFLVLNLGQLVFGLGAGWIVTVLELILVRAFPQHSLAFAMGSLFAMGKLSSFLATGMSVHIVDWLGFYGGVFWVGLIFTLLSLVASVVYSSLSDSVAYETEDNQEKGDEYDMAEVAKDDFNLEDNNEESIFRLLPHNHTYNWKGPVIALLSFDDCTWFYLLVLRLLIGATWTPFAHLASNIVKHMYGVPDAEAAWQASLILALPILMGPFFGFILDRVSLSPAPQPYFVSLGFLFVFLSFLFMDPLVASSPYPSLVMFALALGCGPLALATLPPILVKGQHHVKQPMLGSLLGMQSSITHMVGSLMDTITGWVQDHYANAYPLDPRNGYTQVMSLLKFFSCLGFIASVLFVVLWFPPSFLRSNANQHHWTRVSDSKDDSILNFPLRRYLCVFFAVCIFVVSWGTFFFVLVFSKWL